MSGGYRPTIITGGQTGVDQAAWRAAAAVGLPTGGWMPRGFLTLDGPRPEFAELYGAREHATERYPGRTEANVIESDATLWMGDHSSAGGRLTLDTCINLVKPVFVVAFGDRPGASIDFILRYRPARLNVAGNRERPDGTLGPRAERFLLAVFRRVAGISDDPQL